MSSKKQSPDPADIPVGLLPLSIERKCEGCGELATLDDIGCVGSTIAFIHSAGCGHVIELAVSTVVEEHIS